MSQVKLGRLVEKLEEKLEVVIGEVAKLKKEKDEQNQKNIVVRKAVA